MNKAQLKAQAEALLNEKLSDEELDGVAGGSHQENVEILTAMTGIDPNGTMEFLKKWDQRADDAEFKLATGMNEIIRSNFNKRGMSVAYFLKETGSENLYFVDGKKVSHGQFMDYLHIMNDVDDF